MSWFKLADSAIGAAVQIEGAKNKRDNQQATVEQTQQPQVTPKQTAISQKPESNNKILLVAGGGVAVVLAAVLLLRK